MDQIDLARRQREMQWLARIDRAFEEKRFQLSSQADYTRERLGGRLARISHDDPERWRSKGADEHLAGAKSIAVATAMD